MTYQVSVLTGDRMAALHPGEGDERRRSLGNGTHVGGSRGRHYREQVLTFNVSV